MVRDNVKLHPEAVAKAETLARERRKRRPRRSEPPVTRRYRKRPPWLSPLVWDASLRLAGGDYKRLEIESGSSVLVKNS